MPWNNGVGIIKPWLRASSGRLLLFTLSLQALLSACSFNENDPPPVDVQQLQTQDTTPKWLEGVYAPSETFANYCESPREGEQHRDQPGSAMHEKLWLRSMSHELYLWSDLLEDINPESYGVGEYFDLLQVPGDRFHWSQETVTYQQGSHSGVFFGYGITWDVVEEPHSIGVQRVAEAAGLGAQVKRGDLLLAVDGIPLFDDSEAGGAIPDSVWDAFYPEALGETHVFSFRDRDSGAAKDVVLEAKDIAEKSVPVQRVLETGTGNVGYVQFDRHNAVAQAELLEAFTELESANVNDLVLDMRYNGGGFISVASELAYMIAGPGGTADQVFTQLQYNDKLDNKNPFTGREEEPFWFEPRNSLGQNLPNLGLDRVYVLTSRQTCSASELVMNGLAGVGVEVIQIGGATCGKPYGYYPLDNCGTTYFTIMSKQVNAKGYGDYDNGFSASEFNYEADDVFQGCDVADDFTRDLGDPNEAMFSAALIFREQGICPQTETTRVETRLRSDIRLYQKLQQPGRPAPLLPFRTNQESRLSF